MFYQAVEECINSASAGKINTLFLFFSLLACKNEQFIVDVLSLKSSVAVKLDTVSSVYSFPRTSFTTLYSFVLFALFNCFSRH